MGEGLCWLSKFQLKSCEIQGGWRKADVMTLEDVNGTEQILLCPVVPAEPPFAETEVIKAEVVARFCVHDGGERRVVE